MYLPLQENAIKNIGIFVCYISDISASNAILISKKGGDLSKQDCFDARVSGFLTSHSNILLRDLYCENFLSVTIQIEIWFRKLKSQNFLLCLVRKPDKQLLCINHSLGGLGFFLKLL
jgi:hypothetical protein